MVLYKHRDNFNFEESGRERGNCHIQAIQHKSLDKAVRFQAVKPPRHVTETLRSVSIILFIFKNLKDANFV